MRIPRVYIDALPKDTAELALNRETSHYLSRVLRLPVDAKIAAFDGKGGEYAARITQIEKHQTTIALGRFNPDNHESPLSVHLAIGISRGERMDFVIQKATELGVCSITPLFSDRCEVKLKADRQDKKLHHWRKVAVSACEQCGRNLLPVINAPSSLTEWVTCSDQALKLMLHLEGESPLEGSKPPQSVALLIGPEGGLTENEVKQALDSGFKALQLGPRVLRTETAPLAALSILQYRWGDLKSPG